MKETLQFSVKSLAGTTLPDSATLCLSFPKTYFPLFLPWEEGKSPLINKGTYLLHRIFYRQRQNERQGSHSTKTRAEVRGGGRKPWQQKGSGRARAGSIRSPLWKGGGVAFGPKPKTYALKTNRKEWRLGLRLLLASHAHFQRITVVDDFSLSSFKTKDLVKSLGILGQDPREKTVIVVSEVHENLRVSCKNLKNVKLLKANALNLKDLCQSQSILLTKESLPIIETTYNHDEKNTFFHA